MKTLLLIVLTFSTIALHAQSADSLNRSMTRLEKKYDFDRSIPKWYRLRHFSSGVNLGYGTGIYDYSSEIYMGLSHTFCSSDESFAFNIDNSMIKNTVNGKWYFVNSISYRFNTGFITKIEYDEGIDLSIGLSSNIISNNNRLLYIPQIFFNHDVGLYLIGVFYSFNNSYSFLPTFGAKLMIRPFYLLQLLNNP